jgi:hypothetical protein
MIRSLAKTNQEKKFGKLNGKLKINSILALKINKKTKKVDKCKKFQSKTKTKRFIPN